MFVMCPLVHNYYVITLDYWHLAYCDIGSAVAQW